MTTWFAVQLGSLGRFEISHGLIFSLKDIFGTSINSSYKLLYVPALIPFVVTVLIAIPVFKVSQQIQKISSLPASNKLKIHSFALVGALIMVNLMLVGGDGSMVKIIGKSFAAATGEYWTSSAYLGAVGAFFFSDPIQYLTQHLVVFAINRKS